MDYGYTFSMSILGGQLPWLALYALELLGLLALFLLALRKWSDRASLMLAVTLLAALLAQAVSRTAALGFFGAWLDGPGLVRVDQFAAVLLAVLAWHTLMTLLNRPMWLVFGGGLAAAVLSGVLQNILLVFVAWVAAAGVLLFFVVSRLRAGGREIQQNRLSYWLPAVSLLIFNDILIFYAQTSQWTFLRLAVMALLAYSLLAGRAADLRDLLRQLLTYLTASVAMMGVYVAGYLGGQVVLGEMPGFNPLLLGAGVALVLSFIFAPVLGVTRSLFNKLFTLQTYDASRILREYATSVSNILDLDKLATVSVGLIMEALEIRRGVLFLVEMEISEQGRLYRLTGIQGAGTATSLEGVLAEDSPIVGHFVNEREPVLQADVDFDPRFLSAALEERKWLAELGMAVYVPILAKGEWIGLLALGPKPGNRRYTDEDLGLLNTIAGQTAVALENARLVENLKKLNTQVREAYSYLDKANNHLEQLEMTKSNFISIASHELRTPLTVAKGYAEMLLENPSLPENIRPVVEGIQKSTLRLYEIMESMFEIAQLDARTMELHRQDLFINETLRFVFDEVSKFAAEREQELTLELPQLPSIKADPNSLHKLFRHLLMNAIKFTPNGGKITVTGKYVAANNRDLPEGGVEIVVVDSGVGIATEMQEVIFTRFYQPGDKLNKHSTGKTKFQGSGAGLGLALSKGIVEAHGGRIWVESDGYDEKKYPGSQFHVILPLRAQDESKTVRMGSAVKLKL